MRGFFRAAVVIVLTLLVFLDQAGDVLNPWSPWASFGFTTDTGGIVTSVDAYAAGRGLHVGDRVDPAAMPLRDRVYLWSAASAAPGRSLLLPLRSGARIALVAHPRSRSFLDNLTVIPSVLAALLYVLLAALLVLLRPMPATWAFFLFSQFLLYTGDWDGQFFPTALSVVMNFVQPAVNLIVSPIAFFSFAVRFPNAQPVRAWARFERLLLFGIAPALILWNLFIWCGILAAIAVPRWETTAISALAALLYVPGVVALFARYASAPANERARLRWIVAAFSLAFVPILCANVVQNAIGYIGFIWVENAAVTWTIIAPLALTYTILRHRLFDIRFVVSRALIYAMLTSVTVGVLALADWGFGKWLAQSRFHLLAEVALALALGFSLTALHGRIERLLNAVIFRAQTLALAAIRRFTHEIDLITDAQSLIAQTRATLTEHLECAFVAIYTTQGGAFVRCAPGEPALPPLFSANDLAVLRLRRWNEAFECNVRDHALLGALLVPMTARAQLVGFIACGPKPDGTHYLPDETNALEVLAHHAASAYAWLTLRPERSGLTPELVP